MEPSLRVNESGANLEDLQRRMIRGPTRDQCWTRKTTASPVLCFLLSATSHSGMEPSDASSAASIASKEAQDIASVSFERAAGSKSSKSSDGSSQRSPSLSPSQIHPMTSSLISNLDLGEEKRGENSSDFNASGSKSSFEEERTSSASESVNGRPVPLAPRDVLAQPPFIARANLSGSTSQGSLGSNSLAALGADDSALDALVEAHQKQNTPQLRETSTSSEPPQTPSEKQVPSATPHTRDASFGLDPDADTSQSLEGTPFRFATPHHRHDLHDRSGYDNEEVSAPSHTTAASGAPETMKTDLHHTKTVPTASATGMPRIWPRRTSRSPSETSSSYSSQPHAPSEMLPQYPPSGSLTLAIFAKNISWQRRGYLLLASVAINLGLPFINGVMLGFGEIFARSIVAPYIGLAPASININAPGSRTAAGTGGTGLHYAGIGESKGTGGSRVSVESWELEAGQSGRERR